MSQKNLFDQEAITKIKELAEGGFIMLCTDLGSQPFGTCPMNVQQVDESGNLWFLSGKDSDHNADIANDGATQILLAKSSSSDYLSLYGQTEILYDKAKVEELWSPLHKTWFPGGPTDPNLSLLRFTPSDGYYWDTKNGRMVAFAKMLISAVTDAQMDDSVQGKIEL